MRRCRQRLAVARAASGGRELSVACAAFIVSNVSPKAKHSGAGFRPLFRAGSDEVKQTRDLFVSARLS